MQKLSLTDLGIKALPVAELRAAYYWDTTTKGLGLAVSPKGIKTFVVLISSGRREKLGRWPDLKLADARIEARKTLGAIALGRHRPESKAFDDAKTEFLTFCEAKNRPRTVRDYTRLLKHFPFGRAQLGDITKRDIAKRIDTLKAAPSEAAHALVAAKVFFRWTTMQGYLEISPCTALQAPQKGNSRERVLTDDELKEVFSKATGTFGQIVQLCILTGQRRSEVGGLRWEYFDTDAKTITLPGSVTKNKRTHLFPYGQMVADILDHIPRSSDYLFPASRSHVRGKPTTFFNGWPKAKAEFDAKLENVAHWTLHDLRRTYSSDLPRLKIQPHIIERLINHISGQISGVSATYNRYQYLPEMREATQAWENWLQQLVR